MTVPAPVAAVVAAWRAAGAPIQPAIAWPRDRWVAAFPELASDLGALPDALDRQVLRAACRSAGDGPQAARAAFVTVMAWGYGSVGYGPFRTRRSLAETTDAARRLHSVVGTLATDGPIAAYRRLGDATDSRLTGLGPAFGTKFLFFCQPDGSSTTALIFDNLMSTWLAREVGVKLNPVPWSAETYNAYLRRMHEWSRALECRPDELEACIFRAMATERGNQWGG